jgi:hypothetical protein
VNAKKKPIPVSDEDQFIEEASLQLEEMLKIITDKCFLKIIIRPISKGSESEISFFTHSLHCVLTEKGIVWIEGSDD